MCHAEREQYKISIEVYPAQESYDIGTQVTLRCILPPSLQRSPFITIDWKTTVPNVLRYVGVDRSNVSFVVPAHHPISANYYCSVQGMDYPPTEVARQRITIKIKGEIKSIAKWKFSPGEHFCQFLCLLSPVKLELCRALTPQTHCAIYSGTLHAGA